MDNSQLQALRQAIKASKAARSREDDDLLAPNQFEKMWVRRHRNVLIDRLLDHPVHAEASTVRIDLIDRLGELGCTFTNATRGRHPAIKEIDAARRRLDLAYFGLTQGALHNHIEDAYIAQGNTPRVPPVRPGWWLEQYRSALGGPLNPTLAQVRAVFGRVVADTNRQIATWAPQAQAIALKVFLGLWEESQKAVLREDGRPSDAVRAYLKRTKGKGAERRGELLAEARKDFVRLTDSVYGGAKAKLVPVPTVPVPPERLASLDRYSTGWDVFPDGGYEVGRVGLLDPIVPMLTMEPFTGGGLWALASATEGNVLLDGCEQNRHAVATLNANRVALRVSRDFEAKVCKAHRWRPPLTTPGGLDLLYGGPPCQPFSKASQMGRSPSEMGPGAADNMFPLVLDWMCDLQPRIVCWENSPRLVTNTRYRKWLSTWQRQAKAIGYDSTVYCLRAANFGNPTQRERAFVVAWPAGASWGAALSGTPEGNYDQPGSAAVKKGQKLPWMPMVDRLTSGCCGGWGFVDCRYLGGFELECRTCVGGKNFAPAPNASGEHGRRGLKGVMVPVRGTTRSVPWYKWVARNVTNNRQPRYDKYTPADARGALTSIAAGARDLELPGRRISAYLMRTVVPAFARRSDGLLLPGGIPDAPYEGRPPRKPWTKAMLEQMQMMSVRDVAKLQDVPQWYELKGSRNQAIQQLGNGVPVNLGRGVIRHLRSALGLNLRAPWWELQKPATPRPIRYQTREQIMAAPDAGELVPGQGAGIPDGLWPMDSMDMCFAVPQVVLDPGGWHEIEEDWQYLVGSGELGAQAQRSYIVDGQPSRYHKDGRTRLDRGATRLASDAQRDARLDDAVLSGAVFTVNGPNLIALWESGDRGNPETPPSMTPGVGDPMSDADERWAHALNQIAQHGPHPWITHWGMVYRERYPHLFAPGHSSENLDWYGRSWPEVFSLTAPLPPPAEIKLVAPGDRHYTQADLHRARAGRPIGRSTPTETFQPSEALRRALAQLSRRKP